MKASIYAFVALLSISSLFSQEPIQATYSTYYSLDAYNTFFYFNRIPESDCSITLRRPLLKDFEEITHHCERKEIEERRPDLFLFSILCSEGALPGEKIFLTLDVENVSIPGEVILYPIQAKSREDSASISAELICIEPTSYKITLEGFAEGEICLVHSKYQSQFETLTNGSTSFYSPPPPNPEFECSSEFGCFLEGYSEIQVIRESKETLNLLLPLGEELLMTFLNDPYREQHELGSTSSL